MASLGKKFDPTEHDTTQSDYSELPNGIYKLEIETSDVVETSTGSGIILKTTMVVVEPEDYKGRKIFTNYNVENKNPQAQEIGQRQLSSLCRAVGHSGELEDSEDLHFKAFTAKIALGKPSKDGQYPARAEIKRYYFEDEGNVPEPEIDATQPQAAKPANDNRTTSRPAASAKPAGARPWGKK